MSMGLVYSEVVIHSMHDDADYTQLENKVKGFPEKIYYYFISTKTARL